MRAFTAAVIAATFLLSGAVAFAQAPGPVHVREACRADIATLCQGIQPGEGRIRACLRANRDRLSESCKSAIAARIQARRAMRQQQQSQQPGQPPAPPPGN